MPCFALLGICNIIANVLHLPVLWRCVLRAVCCVLADPQRRAAALETTARGELTMQGPVTLLQGWRGAVGRLPVFIANVSANETFKCAAAGGCLLVYLQSAGCY
jgi:sensor domain CHASE-containing protein